jgi:hypothetical protein
MHRPASMTPNTRNIAIVSAMTAALAACSKPKNAIVDTTTPQPPVSSSAPTTPASPDTMTMVRGTIASVSANQVVVTPDSGGSKTVALTAPVTVYDRAASTLANVKDNTFIGVTTVKQPDGTERATEIHIFPEALRGLGEGSRMMATGAQMTNGSATPARMSNGNVTASTGSTMVVQFAGGSQSVTIPPNTPVTEIKATTKSLATGDKVVVVATKSADGSLSANRVLLAGK